MNNEILFVGKKQLLLNEIVLWMLYLIHSCQCSLGKLRIRSSWVSNRKKLVLKNIPSSSFSYLNMLLKWCRTQGKGWSILYQEWKDVYLRSVLQPCFTCKDINIFRLMVYVEQVKVEKLCWIEKDFDGWCSINEGIHEKKRFIQHVPNQTES